MKLNWGTGLAIVIVIFLIVTIAVVIWTTTHDVNLVADNYYEKEIKYQEQIDKIERTNKLSEQVLIKTDGENISVSFPKIFSFSSISGELKFYRPSSGKSDISSQIKLDSTFVLNFPKKDIQKGVWRIQIDWRANDETFYNEKIVMID